MVQTIYARDVSLLDLKTQFNLTRSTTDLFFNELNAHLPQLSSEEQKALDRVRSQYEHLIQGRPLSEESVKLVVLARLLDLAGFYEEPFEIETETPIKITAEDEGVEIKGNIDVLVVSQRLWVLVIEAKGTKFDVMTALPQALSHMLNAPQKDKPLFGLLLNGREFVFVRLTQAADQFHYSLSNAFSILQPEQDLYNVLGILQQIASFVSSST